MQKIVITFAIEAELIPIKLTGCKIISIITGIGKAKAAMMLTKAILEENPDWVINVGTSGTLNHRVGDIFVCKRFIDRDFHTVQLPGIEFEHNFHDELSLNKLIADWTSTNGSPNSTCNTGDSFVTQAKNLEGDVVDMEAFAQAMVCKAFHKPFIAVKYVTDVIGQNSVKHWEDKLEDARIALTEWFVEK